MAKRIKSGNGSSALEVSGIDPGGMLAASDPSEPADQTVGLLCKFLEYLALDDRGLRGRPGILVVKTRELSGRYSDPITPDIVLDPTQGEEHFYAVAQRITTEAHSEAMGLGQGTWPFVVFAKREGEANPFSRRSFTVHIDNAPGGDIGPEQDGSLKSLLAQNQRHIEAQMRINVQALSYVVAQTNALLQIQTARNEEYERTHADALMLFKAGLEDKETREAEREARMVQQRRMDKALEMLGENVMPAAMGMLAAWLEKNGHLPKSEEKTP